MKIKVLGSLFVSALMLFAWDSHGVYAESKSGIEGQWTAGIFDVLEDALEDVTDVIDVIEGDTDTGSSPSSPVETPPWSVGVQSVKVWVSAFISNQPAETPNLFTIPSGPFAGKTSISGPLGSYYYLTNLRGFGNVPDLSSKLTTMLTINPHEGTITQFASSDGTISVNASDYSVACSVPPVNSNMVAQAGSMDQKSQSLLADLQDSRFEFIGFDPSETRRVNSSTGKVNWTFAARALGDLTNWCVSDSVAITTAVNPDINFNVRFGFFITEKKNENSVLIMVNSEDGEGIDDYPSFESYATVTYTDGVEETQEAFRYTPSGSSPFSLYGGLRDITPKQLKFNRKQFAD